MPVTPPTYASDPPTQAQANAAAATICGFVDDVQVDADQGIADAAAAQADATQGVADAATAQTTADDTKAALLAWVTAVQQFIIVTNSYKPNGEPVPPALANAFSTLSAALAP